MVRDTLKGEIQILSRLFAKHGLPDTIISDNDNNFTSKAFKEFANGIKHLTTAFYHPSSNGITERAVKTFKEYLRKAINSTYADSSIKILVNIQTYTTSCHRRGTQ